MRPRSGETGRDAGTRVRKGRLKVHDPFELIRWLALSQTDPRKALAELVQNSLDAGARSIEVIRERMRGMPCLHVLDDGEGVIPELDRQEALRYIATHVGHSRKRSLTPSERLELMTQGQYGIGLLGFWCLGQALELRSSMPGQKPHRSRPHARPTGLHDRAAARPPRPRPALDRSRRGRAPSRGDAGLVAARAAEYLAAELRGQLLARDVTLEIHDRMSRGSRRSTSWSARSGSSASAWTCRRVELPAIRRSSSRSTCAARPAAEDGTRGIGVYAAGTLVADDFHGLAPIVSITPPWTDSRLTGWSTFRRLRLRQEAAAASSPTPTARRSRTRCAGSKRDLRLSSSASSSGAPKALDRTVIRDLQRAFRDFYRQRPRYTMLPVERKEDLASGPSGRSEAQRARGGASAAGTRTRPLARSAAPLVERPPRRRRRRAALPLPSRAAGRGSHRAVAGSRRVRRAANDPRPRARRLGPARYRRARCRWHAGGSVGRLRASGATPRAAYGSRRRLEPAEDPLAARR